MDYPPLMDATSLEGADRLMAAGFGRLTSGRMNADEGSFVTGYGRDPTHAGAKGVWKTATPKWLDGLKRGAAGCGRGWWVAPNCGNLRTRPFRVSPGLSEGRKLLS